MKRRSFLNNAALATASITTLLATGCNAPATTNNAAAQSKDETSSDAFELQEETIQSIKAKMAAGKYTAQQLVSLYLKRIQEIDKNGYTLNAVIELNPDAASLAIKMDEERKVGKTRGPLHGIPVLIKDNIDTADKMQTTAGALALAGNIAKQDAFIVEQLRAAGAIILGKTNLSEWANFRSNKSCSGWSSRGGQTKNPYILDHNPCGSSAGSGVAVSANLCMVAVGTETDGSIVCPAAINGIVGIKPTVGLVSRSGIIPISATQDTAGPMARTVTDAAILLGVLTGTDTRDAITKESEGKGEKDYTKYLDTKALKGKRIGIERKPQGTNAYLHTLLKNAKDLLIKQGATIIEVDYLDAINALGEAEFEVLQFEFKDGVNKYLNESAATTRSLKDVIAFNIANEDKAMPYFKQETLESCEAKTALTDAKYLAALKKSHEGSKAILDKVMNENKLDAIFGLTMGPACSIDMIYGDRWGDVSLTTPAAISGYPHITVPCGMVYDLPVGLSFFGRAYTEPLLIGIGFAYEQASKKRLQPKFKKSFL